MSQAKLVAANSKTIARGASTGNFVMNLLARGSEIRHHAPRHLRFRYKCVAEMLTTLYRGLPLRFRVSQVLSMRGKRREEDEEDGIKVEGRSAYAST